MISGIHRLLKAIHKPQVKTFHHSTHHALKTQETQLPGESVVRGIELEVRSPHQLSQFSEPGGFHICKK